MTMRVSDKLIYPSRVMAVDAVEGMPDSALTDKVRQFAVALSKDCHKTGIDFAYAFAHAANECDYFRDSDWTRDTNAFGIGNTDGSGGVVFPSPDACADFFTWELLTKMGQDASAFTYVREYAPAKYDRVLNIVAQPDFPQVTRIENLNDPFGDNDCVWMCDEFGPEAIVAKARALYPNVPDQGGTDPVAGYTTTVPGLPGGQLVTTHPIYIKLIPEWRTNNRPGITARTPRRAVQHGNGNPNSSAAGEANYLFNGAEGRQASYHSTTDDKESWIMVPANEVTWQAADGSGPGNMNGFSNEMVEDSTLWANPTRRDRVIANAAELMGGIAARLDIDKPEQHWTFNFNNDPSERHDCPNKLRYTTINGRPAWEIYAEKWRAAKAAERKRMNGEEVPTTPTTPPTPKPIYADALTVWMGNDLKAGSPSDHSLTFKVEGVDTKVKVWGAQREYECIKSTPRYLGPDSKGKKVGGNLVVGEEFVGSYFTTVGKTRWVVTRYGSWIRADALTPRVSVRAA